MIRVVFVAILLLSTVVRAQDDAVYHAEVTREKALVDEYLARYTAQSKPLVTEVKLLKRLFDSYDREVYRETLLYVESFAVEYPDAVLALSDSIQTYWDSHYLHSFISGSSAEYGKLKFLSALGAAGFTNLLQKLGMDNSKRPLRWLAKLLSFENGKQWNFAGLPTNLKAFKRLGVVGEPTAAAFAQGAAELDVKKLKRGVNYLMYDFGGGTMDVSIVTAKLEKKQRIFKVTSIAGNPRLGGDDIDKKIAEKFAKDLGISDFDSANDKTRSILRRQAEEAKINLSDANNKVYKSKFELEGKDVEIEIGIDAFNQEIADTIDKTIDLTEQAIDDAPNLNIESIDAAETVTTIFRLMGWVVSGCWSIVCRGGYPVASLLPRC